MQNTKRTSRIALMLLVCLCLSALSGALAGDVTDDCDHDGAAHAIEKYMPRARIADVG